MKTSSSQANTLSHCSYSRKQIFGTVEPHYTTTSLTPPLFCPGKMLMHFLIKLPR